MDITVRHSEPEDYEALHRIFSGPRAAAGTLQMPFPSARAWRERLAEPPEGMYSLVACVDEEVVGSLSLENSPTRWRMRHVGSIEMAVRDDWQGKGVGTALMEAALDLAGLSARRFAPCQHGASRLVSTALRALSARSGFQPSLVSNASPSGLAFSFLLLGCKPRWSAFQQEQIADKLKC